MLRPPKLPAPLLLPTPLGHGLHGNRRPTLLQAGMRITLIVGGRAEPPSRRRIVVVTAASCTRVVAGHQPGLGIDDPALGIHPEAFGDDLAAPLFRLARFEIDECQVLKEIRILGVPAQLAGPATIIRQAPAARCR